MLTSFCSISGLAHMVVVPVSLVADWHSVSLEAAEYTRLSIPHVVHLSFCCCNACAATNSRLECTMYGDLRSLRRQGLTEVARCGR